MTADQKTIRAATGRLALDSCKDRSWELHNCNVPGRARRHSQYPERTSRSMLVLRSFHRQIADPLARAGMHHGKPATRSPRSGRRRGTSVADARAEITSEDYRSTVDRLVANAEEWAAP
jgi:hypothetical protein